MPNHTATFWITAAAILASAGSAMAGGHTWRVNELYSNADGTIQFIELKECCGGNGEIATAGHAVTSGTKSFTLTSNVASPTAHKTILIATPAYAALPGVPTPDYILPPGSVPFFDPNGDTITYVPYDTMTFVAGQLPTNCRCSRQEPLTPGPAFVALSTPKNYGDQTAFVDACQLCPGDVAPDCGDNAVGVADLLKVISFWGPCGTPTYCPVDCSPPAGDGTIGVADLLAVISNWGPCK